MIAAGSFIYSLRRFIGNHAEFQEQKFFFVHVEI
jgi:hypothetical protein